jgi:hypothetical protein
VPRSINEIIAENERLEALLDSGVREELLAIAGVFHRAKSRSLWVAAVTVGSEYW